MSSHRTRHLTALAVVVAVLAGFATSCSDDSPVAVGPLVLPGNAAPAFSLVDHNKTSATYGDQVSPRGHVDRISAWYFGRAT